MSDPLDTTDGTTKTLDPSAGGMARWEGTTPEQRSDAARKAAQSRWHGSILKATYGSPDHPLDLGGIQIPCYVLENEQRVVVQTGMIRALGMSKGGSSHRGGTRLAKFVAGDRFKDFVSKELIEGTQNPIRFVTTTGHVAYGFDAQLLADICEAVLQAKNENKLQPQQLHIAERCWILYKGIARVGIVALIDEVTGYQNQRGREDLRKILEQYVSKELARWERTFDPDFYKHMHRLKGWKYDPTSTKRSHAVARLTVDWTYDRIHPDLLEELKRVRNDNNKPNSKLFQWLTTAANGGHPRLKQHLEGLTALLKVARTEAEFKGWINEHYPKFSNTAYARAHTPAVAEDPAQPNLFDGMDPDKDN
jgi:hypothetical protein